MGIMAGVFQLYTYAIMPGLGRTDDGTFVGAFQAIDTAIINPVFMLTFAGALAFSGLATALQVGENSVLPWTATAGLLYLVVFVITIVINVPLNDAMKAAGRPDRVADLAGVRRRFDEAKWARWNLVRALLTTLSFVLLTWSLVVFGRL
jgi:uncharacterized membrane protein